MKHSKHLTGEHHSEGIGDGLRCPQHVERVGFGSLNLEWDEDGHSSRLGVGALWAMERWKWGRDKPQAVNQQRRRGGRGGRRMHPETAGYGALDSPILKGFFVKGC